MKNAGPGRVTVYFIDYGNYEEVAAADLKELNSDMVHLNAQAIKCRLKDIRPVSGSVWSDASVGAFQELIADKGLFAYAINQTNDGVFEISLFDTNSSDDMEIGQELVKMGIAQSPHTTQPGTMEKYKPLSVTSGQSYTVALTSLENPSSFWCQLVDEKPQADLEKVMSEMAVYYKKPESKQDVLQYPTVGMPCAAQFTEDDIWYRAAVIAVKGNMFEVRYVDYGNSETLQQDRLRILKSSFMASPPISFCCELYDVVPIGSGWTPKASREFRTMVNEKLLTAKVKAVDPQRKVTVELLDRDVNVADSLVSANCAAKMGKQSTAPTSARQEHHTATRQQTIPYKYSFPSLEVGQTEKMVVSYVASPSEIWCQSPSSLKLLENMQRVIQNVYCKLPPGKAVLDKVVPDVACVAKSPSYNVWYRALISQVLGNNEVEVHYIDYGNLEVVQQSEIKALHRDFKGVPAQALLCSLYQCHEPADGWTDAHRDALDSLAADVELTGEVKSVQSNPTKMVVEMSFIKEGVKMNLKDEFLLIMRDIDVSAVQSSSPEQQLTMIKMEVSPSNVIEQESATTSCQVQTVKIDLTPLNLQIGKFESVCIVGVKTVDQMWCQLIKTASQINELTQSIAAYIKEGVQPLTKPSVGQFCLAQYLDGAYYRGHIKNVHPDGKVEVFFIDYGNVEKVESNALNDISSDQCKLPAQAFTCRLAGVKPVQPGRWSQEASAFLERITIGKHLVARRVQAPDVAIELFDTSDPETDLNIGDELIRAGMAIADSIAVHEVERAVINPIHMLPGKEYNVIVTHVISPVRFYCQVQNFADEFAVLADELYAYCSNLSQGEGSPGPLESSVGQFVAASYSVDGGWYRAKVTSVTDEQAQTVNVVFVDYGNEETVKWSSVKCLLKKFVKLHALCFESTLDVLPSDLSSDDTHRFMTAVSDREFSCRVLSSDSDGRNTVQLLHQDKRTNVADELHFKPKVSPPKAPPGCSLDYTHPRLVEGKTVKVFGTVCEKPGLFWCQPSNSAAPLETLMADIQDHYGVLSPSEKTFTTATANSACCARYSQDQDWYRARIKEVSGSEVSVHYVDYGNSEALPLSQLKVLSPNFVELPAQAVLCHLMDACSSRDWSPEVLAEYEKLIQDQELEVVVKSVVGPGEVEVDIPMLREQLQELGMIQTTTTSPVTVVDPSFKVSHVQVHPGSEYEVYVSHVDSHECVWCQLVSQTDELESLSTKMQEFYSNPEMVSSLGSLMNIHPDSVCCGKYSYDENWYRAAIIEISDKDVTLHFIDYGNTGTVQYLDAKPLLKQFSTLPSLAFPCHVSGLSSSQCDELKRLAQENSFFCSVTGMDKELAVVDLCIKDNQGKQINILEVLTTPMVKDGEAAHFQEMWVTEGSAEKVYVSHVVSPSHFYCQLVSSKDQLDALMDQVAQYSSDTISNNESRTVGSLCVAKYSQDEQYYRAKIEEVGDHSCDIVFIDYGNSDTVEYTNIKQISTELCQLPAFGIQCQLAETAGHKWEKQSIDQFVELTQEEVTCHFVKEVNGVWDVNIETESGSMKSALSAQGLVPLSPGPAAKEASFPQVQVTIDSVVDAYISSAINPETFYIHLQHQSEELQCLVEKLAESYVSLAEDDFVVPSPVEGMLCCAQFSADQQWYRALVMKVAGIDCEVLFVDYGNQETVPLSRVKELRADLAAIPAQAVLCSLMGVKPSEEQWSEEAVTMLYEIMTETQLKVHVLSKSGEKYLTEVVIAETGESLADKLILGGHAVKDMGAPPADVVAAKTSEGLSGTVAVTESESSSPTTQEEVIPEVFISLQLSVGDQLDAKVVHIETPDMFFCQPATSADELQKLAESLADTYAESESASRSLPREQLLPNIACAAKYTEDGVWYRTKIMSVSEDTDTASVLFVDYGNKETVTTDQLLLLNPELQSLPAQAIPCCLANTLPSNMEHGWSGDIQTAFREIAGDVIFSCVVVSVQPEGVYEVQLTNIETGESLADLLIANGLAISEMTELETSKVLQWQTGMVLSEQAAEGGESGDVPCVKVDRSLGNMEEVRYEIQPDITRDVTERGIEDGSQLEHAASPTQPDLVTNQVDDFAVEPPTAQPDVLIAQVDLIAQPLAEPEIQPEEPDIQKSVRLSQQEEAAALPQIKMSKLDVIDATSNQSADTAVIPIMETTFEVKPMAKDQTPPEDETVEADLVTSGDIEDSLGVSNEAVEDVKQSVPQLEVKSPCLPESSNFSPQIKPDEEDLEQSVTPHDHEVRSPSLPESASSLPQTKPDDEVEALRIDSGLEQDGIEVCKVDIVESVRPLQEPTRSDGFEVSEEESAEIRESFPEAAEAEQLDVVTIQADTVKELPKVATSDELEVPLKDHDTVEPLLDSAQHNDLVDESRPDGNGTGESFAKSVEKQVLTEDSSIKAGEIVVPATERSRMAFDDTVASFQEHEMTDRQETDPEQAVASKLVEVAIQTAVDRVEKKNEDEAYQIAALLLKEVVNRVVSEVAGDFGGSESSDDKTIDEYLQQVVITFVEEDGRFWARIGNDEDHRQYTELVERMNDHYGPLEIPEDQDVTGNEELAKSSLPGQFSVNDLCAVPRLEDGQWYRGRVIGLISDASEGESAYIQLVDSGQVETVAVSLLRPLVTMFSEAPEFATYCALAGIKPEGDGWSNEVKTFLGDLSAGKIIYAQAEDNEDNETTQLHLFAPSEKLQDASFQIYSSQLPLIARSDCSKPPSEVDSLRVEIGEVQDNLSVSSFVVSERELSPPALTLSELKEPVVAEEDTDGMDMDYTSSTVSSSRVSEIVHRPNGYVYINKLIVDQGLAKFIV